MLQTVLASLKYDYVCIQRRFSGDFPILVHQVVVYDTQYGYTRHVNTARTLCLCLLFSAKRKQCRRIYSIFHMISFVSVPPVIYKKDGGSDEVRTRADHSSGS